MDSSGPLVVLRIAAQPFDVLERLGGGEAMACLVAALEIEDAIAAEAARLEDDLFCTAGAPESETSSGRQGVAGAAAGGAAVASAAAPRLALVHARRHVRHRRRASLARVAVDLRESHPELAVRLESFAFELDRHAQGLARFEKAAAAEAAHAATRLAASAGDPAVREVLRLAGHALTDKASRLRRAPPDRWSHGDRHAAVKLLAYLARVATKTSPNGVSCFTAIAHWSESLSCLGENLVARRVTRLSVAEARKVTACLAVDPELADATVPRVNPTLREHDGSWTFWKPASMREENDDEVHRSLRVQPAAARVIEAARQGWALPRLVEESASRLGVAQVEAQAFVRRLIDAGVLIAEVEIPWSEPRPLRALAASARAAGCRPPWLEAVEAIERRVDAIDEASAADRERTMDELEKGLEALPHRRAIHTDELLRVDAATALDASLPHRVMPELDGFAQWYARLYAALYPESGFREAYARRFLARFPADTPIEALDVYHGVFDGETLSRPATFPLPTDADAAAAACRRAHSRIRATLAAAARDAAAAGRDEVDLGAFDWDELFESAAVPDFSCGILFQVVARGAAIDAVDDRLCINAIYPGIGLSVARLSFLHDRASAARIRDELERGWKRLERPGATPVEVSYMHAGRTANAGLRPRVLSCEIELPGHRASDGASSLPLADLTVTFESVTRRFRLRSRSVGTEVLPVVTSGISPEGFVSFLLAIGNQGFQPLGYFPGFDVDGIDRWPRFVLGRVVVWRRRWSFVADNRPDTASVTALAPARLERVTRWRRRQGLPRHVFVHTDADTKPFYVDLESAWMLELLDHRLASAAGAGDSSSALHVTEMLPGPGDLWARDSRGRYVTEFLVHRSHPPAGLA
jgi:hypothetical protein